MSAEHGRERAARVQRRSGVLEQVGGERRAELPAPVHLEPEGLGDRGERHLAIDRREGAAYASEARELRSCGAILLRAGVHVAIETAVP